MRRGITFPPIRVWRDAETYWLSHGLHRLASAELAGLAEIACEVHFGALSDAQWDSYAFDTGGVPRLTLAETRKVHALALQHPTAATLGDSQIASHLGISESGLRLRRKDLILRREEIEAHTSDISDGTVLDAIRYIRANLGFELNVAELARRVGASAPNLRRRFRDAKQSSPHATLTDFRMERARELLSTKQLTLKEVAGQVGYRTPSAFGRAFLQAWGIPPGQLMRRRREAASALGK
jgi:AraC-like DNA-binding protein